MDRVRPDYLLRRLHRRDIQIHHRCFVIAAHQHAFQRLLGAGIDFLVRHIRRHVDEVPRPRLRHEFQLFAPAHPRMTPDDVDPALQRTVMMGTCLRVRMNGNRPSPDLLRTDPGMIDRCRPVHPRRLCSIAVQRVMPDYPDAFVASILALIHLAHLASSAWLPGWIVVKTMSLRYLVRPVPPVPDEFIKDFYRFPV
jgi:hypothetical protein